MFLQHHQGHFQKQWKVLSKKKSIKKTVIVINIFYINFFKFTVAGNIFQKQILVLYYEVTLVLHIWSLWSLWSQCLLSHVASTSNKNPQTQHVVLAEIIGFSFINICILMSSNSVNLGLTLFKNQLFNVSTVNFNSYRENFI